MYNAPIRYKDERVVIVAGKEMRHIILLGGQTSSNLALAAAGLGFEFLQRHALDVPTASDDDDRPKTQLEGLNIEL